MKRTQSQRICQKGLEIPVDSKGRGPSQRTLVEERKKVEAERDAANPKKRHEKVCH